MTRIHDRVLLAADEALREKKTAVKAPFPCPNQSKGLPRLVIELPTPDRTHRQGAALCGINLGLNLTLHLRQLSRPSFHSHASRWLRDGAIKRKDGKDRTHRRCAINPSETDGSAVHRSSRDRLGRKVLIHDREHIPVPHRREHTKKLCSQQRIEILQHAAHDIDLLGRE
jgi:hypothetical protein